MRRSASARYGIIAAALAGCSPGGGPTGLGQDSHIDCAALISAATFVMAGGSVPHDPDVLSKSLGTGMMHLNSYAVPAKIPEKEAMATLKERRDALMATEAPEAIMRRARACIARFD